MAGEMAAWRIGVIYNRRIVYCESWRPAYHVFGNRRRQLSLEKPGIGVDIVNENQAAKMSSAAKWRSGSVA
jgi:hypothetical protein